MLIEYSPNGISESFIIEVSAEEMLERPLLAKFGDSLLGVVIS
jgi:hypothetical protein